jgi:hypothetical protein
MTRANDAAFRAAHERLARNQATAEARRKGRDADAEDGRPTGLQRASFGADDFSGYGPAPRTETENPSREPAPPPDTDFEPDQDRQSGDNAATADVPSFWDELFDPDPDPDAPADRTGPIQGERGHRLDKPDPRDDVGSIVLAQGKDDARPPPSCSDEDAVVRRYLARRQAEIRSNRDYAVSDLGRAEILVKFIAEEGALSGKLADELMRSVGAIDPAARILALRAMAKIARAHPDAARRNLDPSLVKLANEIERLHDDPNTPDSLIENPAALERQASVNTRVPNIDAILNTYGAGFGALGAMARFGRAGAPRPPPGRIEIAQHKKQYESNPGPNAAAYKFHSEPSIVRNVQGRTEVHIQAGDVLPRKWAPNATEAAFPKGFASGKDFEGAMKGFRDAVPPGTPGKVDVGVRGSSLHERKFDRDSKVHSGPEFDKGRASDIDIFVVNKSLYDKARGKGWIHSGGRSQPLDPRELQELGLPGLAQNLKQFRAQTSRNKTRIMLYRDMDALRNRGSYALPIE